MVVHAGVDQLKTGQWNDRHAQPSKVKSDHCKHRIEKTYRRTYGDMEKDLGNIIIWMAHMVMDTIANSDALYHDMEHTIMVPLAGGSIIEGKNLAEGGVSPTDWAHFMIALLSHGIGYVKGICKI